MPFPGVCMRPMAGWVLLQRTTRKRKRTKPRARPNEKQNRTASSSTQNFSKPAQQHVRRTKMWRSVENTYENMSNSFIINFFLKHEWDVETGVVSVRVFFCVGQRACPVIGHTTRCVKLHFHRQLIEPCAVRHIH